MNFDEGRRKGPNWNQKISIRRHENLFEFYSELFIVLFSIGNLSLSEGPFIINNNNLENKPM